MKATNPAPMIPVRLAVHFKTFSLNAEGITLMNSARVFYRLSLYGVQGLDEALFICVIIFYDSNSYYIVRPTTVGAFCSVAL